MRSIGTRRFWDRYNALPAEVQELAVKKYRLWVQDPSHPSLHFRRLKGSEDRFTIRVGDHYRALARVRDNAIYWVWIGTHEEYNRLVHGKA